MESTDDFFKEFCLKSKQKWSTGLAQKVGTKIVNIRILFI